VTEKTRDVKRVFVLHDSFFNLALKIDPTYCARKPSVDADRVQAAVEPAQEFDAAALAVSLCHLQSEFVGNCCDRTGIFPGKSKSHWKN
jgi:hypothetical protein